MAGHAGERIKALEVALNNESRERDFYLRHKERTRNPHGKSMFASIAKDEDEHYQRILELHERLRKEGQWPETVPIKVKDTEVKSLMQKLVEAVDISAPIDKDDLEAVKIAIDFESKGEAFYRELAKSIDNLAEKKFYELLASMEREHLLSLKDTLEYFQDPAGWFRVKERHHIDGA